MKRTKTLAAILGGCLLASAAALAAAEDPAELGRRIAERLRTRMQEPEAMERWQQTMRMGEEHQLLRDAFVGEWDVQMRMWMDPQGDPMESRGTASVEPVFDGRFVRERFRGTAMGQAFEGESVIGYDNVKRLFISTWMDSMGTGIMMMKGSISQDGRTLTFVGEMDEPMTGEMGKAIQMVTTIESADRHKAEMFEIVYGERIRVMELTYTRRGGR